ncbi:MAG: hypothetical protein HY318_05820, partial [Armatimonadetes bacterium]|nr:hypothetical protein [Armatimonadota bacterium]
MNYRISTMLMTVSLVTSLCPSNAASPRSAINLRVDGRSAILTTNRWDATIEDGMVTAFTNKLTGEVVAKRGIDPGFDLPMGLGHQAGALEEAKKLHCVWGCMELKQGLELGEGFPSQHRPTSKSQFSYQRLRDGGGLTLTYIGLSAGK